MTRIYSNYDWPDSLYRLVFGDSEYEIPVTWESDIESVLNTLKERHKNVLTERLKNEKSLKEVSEMYGVTRERIRQIEAVALRKLRCDKRKKNVMLHITE